MEAASWVTLRLLIGRLGREAGLPLVGYLPEEDRRRLGSVVPPEGPVEELLSQAGDLIDLERVQHSWLIPLLEPFEEADRGALLAALPQGPTLTKLQTYFDYTTPLPTLSTLARTFLRDYLVESLAQHRETVLPRALFPPHPLNDLLDYSKRDLQRLINHLGLYDLAFECKQTVESHLLNQVQEALVDREIVYLKRLMREKGQLVFGKIHLGREITTRKRLRDLLFQRGANRLAKAIFVEDHHLLESLCLILDVGRAKVMRRFHVELKDRAIHEKLIEQVRDTGAFIQSG